MGCVDQERLAADIQLIAKERVPGSAHWQSMQDLCRTRLEEHGFEVEVMSYATGVNVIGRRAGTDPAAGEVLVTAHYDHIAGCPGASDNAAGMAAAFEIARLLGSVSRQHTLVIACWDEEETGLIGSQAYSDAASAAGTAIEAMISLDTLGYFSTEANTQTLPSGLELLFADEVAEIENNGNRADFLAVISDASSATAVEKLVAHAASVGLKLSVLSVPENFKLNTATAQLRRSDHASFWANDYPGILLSDTGNFRNPSYHCFNGVDSPETLTMEFVRQTTQIALGAAADVLGTPSP